MTPEVDLSEVARSICNSKDFTFVRPVGGGTYKQVFQVERGENEVFALKVVAEATTRTAREIDALKSCNHPNIAHLFEVGEHDFQSTKYDYLLEEYLGGGTLTQKLGIQGNMNTEHTLRLGEQLISALSHLTCKKLVHRDIKPDNIMFRDDGSTPVLVDFGFVRDLGAVSLTQTGLGQPGTPLFASPEQLNGNKRLINWRTDQFALGVVLCYIRFGVHPYQYSNDTLTYFAVQRVANGENRNVDTLNLIRDSGLECIEKMTKIWPVERYRNPELLMHDWIAQG